MYAYVYIHFGKIPKYLELSIYFLIMLKKYTKHDIIYMYSINDTPNTFIHAIKNLNLDIKLIPYNDNKITYNIDQFKSSYPYFNTLRTCNFIFALELIKYKKLCVIESDMVIMSNIDSIFELNSPAILFYNEKIELNNSNYLIDISKKNIIKICNEKSRFNGGVLLFKPSLSMYKKCVKNINKVIENNCKFPNETLFAYNFKKIYNLPIKYNMSQYLLNYESLYGKILIYHFNSSPYKASDIIKDDYLKKETGKRKEIVLFFKKKIYDKYHKKVEKIMKEFDD